MCGVIIFIMRYILFQAVSYHSSRMRIIRSSIDIASAGQLVTQSPQPKHASMLYSIINFTVHIYPR